MAAWWHNPTNENSLRFTDSAHLFFIKHGVKSEKFECDVLPIILLRLERHMTCPYYVCGTKSVYVYGHFEAVMLHLIDGNIPAYLKNLATA